LASGRLGDVPAECLAAHRFRPDPETRPAAPVGLAGASGSAGRRAKARRCPSNRSGSGSYGLRRSLRGLPRRSAGPPRVSRTDRRAVAQAPRPTGPPDLRLPFGALERALEPKLLLSWDSSFAPPPTSPMRVHSRGTSPPSARRCQAPHTFRPRGFPPPRRLAPRIGSRVCCTPQPVLGFAAFRARGPPRGAEPFEGFPSSTAVPRHRGRVPPCRYRRDVEPCSRGRRRFEAEATNHRVEAPVCRSRPPRRPARARCEHPRHRRGRSTYRGTRDNRGEPSHQEERAALHQVTGGHGRRSGRAARCAVANAGEPAGGRASSSKHLAKRPTSRPCSADESVASHRRCQRGDTRSFHGFCPLQGPRPTAPERRMPRRGGSLPGFADRDRGLGGARRVCPVAGSNRRGPREAGRRNRPSWGF
jgi:hypothetical protein